MIDACEGSCSCVQKQSQEDKQLRRISVPSLRKTEPFFCERNWVVLHSTRLIRSSDIALLYCDAGANEDVKLVYYC